MPALPDSKAQPADERAWIGTRVSKAAAAHPLLPGGIAAHMEDLLCATLGERRLTKAELEKVARELLADMTPAWALEQAPG